MDEIDRSRDQLTASIHHSIHVDQETTFHGSFLSRVLRLQTRVLCRLFVKNVFATPEFLRNLQQNRCCVCARTISKHCATMHGRHSHRLNQKQRVVQHAFDRIEADEARLGIRRLLNTCASACPCRNPLAWLNARTKWLLRNAGSFDLRFWQRVPADWPVRATEGV